MKFVLSVEWKHLPFDTVQEETKLQIKQYTLQAWKAWCTSCRTLRHIAYVYRKFVCFDNILPKKIGFALLLIYAFILSWTTRYRPPAVCNYTLHTALFVTGKRMLRANMLLSSWIKATCRKKNEFQKIRQTMFHWALPLPFRRLLILHSIDTYESALHIHVNISIS